MLVSYSIGNNTSWPVIQIKELILVLRLNMESLEVSLIQSLVSSLWRDCQFAP